METEKRAGFPPMPKGLKLRSGKVDLAQEDGMNEKNNSLGKVTVQDQKNGSQWNEKSGLVDQKPLILKAEK